MKKQEEIPFESETVVENVCAVPTVATKGETTPTVGPVVSIVFDVVVDVDGSTGETVVLVDVEAAALTTMLVATLFPRFPEGSAHPTNALTVPASVNVCENEADVTPATLVASVIVFLTDVWELFVKINEHDDTLTSSDTVAEILTAVPTVAVLGVTVPIVGAVVSAAVVVAAETTTTTVLPWVALPIGSLHAAEATYFPASLNV